MKNIELELVYAPFPEDLAENIAVKLSEGWIAVSEVLTVRPPNLDKEIPHFIYYVQIIAKEG